MRKFGYGRVSTSKQSLELQIKALESEGVEPSRIFTDIGARDSLAREGLDLLRLKVESGDQLLVTRLDRLGSNTVEMINLVNEFTEKGVSIHFIKEGLSTKGEMGKLVVTILSAVADAEKARILERTNEGRQEALSKGVVFGRKPKIDKEKVIELFATTKPTDIAKKLGISRSSVYSILKEKGLTS